MIYGNMYQGFYFGYWTVKRHLRPKVEDSVIETLAVLFNLRRDMDRSMVEGIHV